MAYAVSNFGAMRLVDRDAQACVVCDNSVSLQCPGSCPSGQQCKFRAQNCTQCAGSYCALADTSLPPPGGHSSDGPNVGAIAGGVVAGVIVVAIATYLVWRFCIKTKRQPSTIDAASWTERRASTVAEKHFSEARSNRASTHTAHSIASTVLTRASNIIQIAYIPGVTNRASPNSPGVLVPPVPPIPLALSAQNSPANTEDQHFFVPGDLRDSTYSGLSGYSDRTSYARTSYAARSSIASTIYGKSAVVISPAQTGMRAKPAVVSVKSANGRSLVPVAPPVPAVDYEKYASGAGSGSGSAAPDSPAESTFSVGSTFLNSASATTGAPVRAQVVRVGSTKLKSVTAVSDRASSHSGATGASSSDDSELSGLSELPGDDPGSSKHSKHSSKEVVMGPFADPPSQRSSQRTTSDLSAVILEATRKASASRDPGSRPASEKELSPFSDAHATRD